MPIDPQRALEGYLRALSYDPHEAEAKSGAESQPKAGAKPEPKSGAKSQPNYGAEPEPSQHSINPAPESEPASDSAPRKAPVPAPATEPAPAAGPGLLWRLRLLSLRRASATAEKTRRA
ncbi:hypothetical protein [Streptomyces chrestomyceticus]|uniref:hypothetical protein n=1 Tax=Streptomyces chrestomyceticus TaxID=68185 RepID=UPI0037A4803B